ncbi:MAG TPA: tRNA uridine-5-carboxymethylaminomethyl(34) synthesis GTPase MnmE [Spirochaetia bacterium]|nr:tRNA uridine-5-carboxymethylaminomethyl(34) synthesis GTPase MnmE [Spirochaetia bacterium]
MIHSPDDPIVALATSFASSALAVIRVSGQGSVPLLSRLVRGGGLSRQPGHTIHHCFIHESGEDVDEVMIAVYNAPRSYTGEDGAEIFCHGSIPVIQRLLSLLTRSGFRPAGPGEFTQRAFLNGRMDLTRAEAVNEIVRARTDRARALALQRLGGAIEGKIRSARDGLVQLRAGLEAAIDYPEDDHDRELVDDRLLSQVVETLQGLTRTYQRGRVYQEGASVVIAGATNSGKSSLFNALLRQDRAMVSDVHGTTRDWIEATISMKGIPVRLFDTAGLRSTEDPLEIEGMRRTEHLLSAADLVVFMVDGSAGDGSAPGAGDGKLLPGVDGVPVVRAWNKVDLPTRLPAPQGFIPISAVSGEGLDRLEDAIARELLGGPPGESAEPLIDSVRQRDLIAGALEALGRFRDAREHGTSPDLLAVDLAAALDCLGEITGEVVTEEILDRMFSSFCVGK